MSDFKYKIGDKAWFHWGDWEEVTILGTRIVNGNRCYEVDIASPFKVVHEDLLKKEGITITNLN